MEIARLYLDAHASFAAVVNGLTDAQWATPVPCTPGWTVHDVVSHLAGLTDDAINSRMDGAPGDAWTAAQVERWADTPRAELLAQWAEQAAVVAPVFEQMGAAEPVLDCHTHEHDVRHALDLPGNRDSEHMQWMMNRIATSWEGRPIQFNLVDGSEVVTAGSGAARMVSGITSFDVVRSRLGRRSRAQVREWQWSEPLTDAELDEWFIFGPSGDDIVE